MESPGVVASRQESAASRSLSPRRSCAATENLDEGRRRAGLRTLHQHAEWIRFDPSTHSSANNHRIGELAGLATIGLLAPELASAERAESIGARTACRSRPDRQISARRDRRRAGLRVSPIRRRPFPLGCGPLDRPLGAGPAGDSRPRSTDRQTRCGHRSEAEEPAPTYGDADDGRAVRLDPSEFRDARGVAAGLAAYRGQPRARLVAGRLDAAALWLFGREGAARFDCGHSLRPSPESIALPAGGLVILRNGDSRVARRRWASRVI